MNYCFSYGLPPSANAVSAAAYALRYTPNVLGQSRSQSRVTNLVFETGPPQYLISCALRRTPKEAEVGNLRFANIHQCRINRPG